jgi:hypothetical protein
MKHLRKIVLWSRLCAVIGLGTMWMAPPNLVSIIFLSLWTHSAMAWLPRFLVEGRS